MGRRRPAAFFRTAGFDDDDRFPAGRLPDGPDEFFTVAHAFDVHQDDPGGIVADDVLQKIGFIEIGFVADRDNGGHADVFDGRLPDQGQSQSPALGDHAQMAGRNVSRNESRVEMRCCGINAEDIRPQNAHASFIGILRNFPLFPQISDFREAGRDNDAVFDASVGALPDRIKDVLGRDGNTGDIDVVFYVRDVFVGWNSEDVASGWVDRVDLSGEPAGLDIVQNSITDFAFIP